VEVHYRWHPCFRHRVLILRVERRGTRRFHHVEGPAGPVLVLPAWMFDAAICAGMSLRSPQVDLPAIRELSRLVRKATGPAHSADEPGVVGEKRNEAAGSDPSGCLPKDQRSWV